MKRLRSMGIYFLWCAMGVLCLGLLAQAETTGSAAGASQASALRDGQHDFDFNLGTWTTHIRKLVHPLTGSTTWVELTGTVVVRKVWNGRAQIEEVEAGGPSGHFEGMTLFLYNPEAHQWGMYFANSSGGTIETPSIGEFKDGRGEFYDQETYQGRTILVRVVWSDITPDTHRFEQSFSDDGGKTWEPNFVANLTRNKS
ncbi:MAG: hypothetical protein WCA00_19500 [Candidatus Acidiferrales bacterium]